MEKPVDREGSLRLQSDTRQIAGMLMLTGMCALFQPLFNLPATIGPDGAVPKEGIALSGFIGAFCLLSIGITSVVVGYLQLVHDWGHKNVTFGLILLSQTAFIPYVTGLTGVVKAARTGAAFIPSIYNPSAWQVKFVGAMGFLGIFSYGFTFVGAIAFVQFTLYSYQSGNPQNRPASYYRGRLGLYSAMLFIAGGSQLLLGAFIMSQFNSGLLEDGRIGAAFYQINFPAIAVVVGIVQVCNAMWGMARGVDVGIISPDDTWFQKSILLGWFVQFTLQIMVQLGYPMGDELAGVVPQLTAMSMGLNLMPAYLDWKARTTPEAITPEYYGLRKKDDDLDEDPMI